MKLMERERLNMEKLFFEKVEGSGNGTFNTTTSQLYNILWSWDCRLID